MRKQRCFGTTAITRVARKRSLPRRVPTPVPGKPGPGAVEGQERAPNRMEWPDPLNEEERRALEVGWGFVE